ncbi:MAG TPA: DUF362 domain-containing protein [Bryobacteraceae bacterium]|nr:DUF362 domain-containing protein [Bryobacteraceae bacterium]
MPEPVSMREAGGLPAEERLTRATVAIAHTSEKHRSYETIYALAERALNHLGGMREFVKPGQTVLIKPNVTVFYTAEEGCTTDPYLVAAVARMAKEAGAARVMVGESSGGTFNSIRNMKTVGIAAAAEHEGAELVDLGSEHTPNRRLGIEYGKVLREAILPAPLLDADVIIDMPKAKNHEHTKITGALKNWVGVVNQQWRQQNHGWKDTAARFMDIMTVARPHLCVADAIICGEGDGPIANLPHWAGCVIASTDPVATDVTIARLLGHDILNSDYINEAAERGIGVKDRIDYVGDPLEIASFQAWHNHADFSYFPVNFLVGNGVTMEGTVGHVKSALDSMVRRGELNEVIWLNGTPTIMIGEIDDPHFEEHLRQGPYLVFDDAAKPQYKNDPRVFFVPGHPVLRTAMPSLMVGLSARIPGNAILQWQQFQRWGMSNMKYGTPARRALTVAQTVAAAAALAGAGVLLANGARKFARWLFWAD